MKIISLHNLEDVANLLTNLTMITEVDVLSVPNLEKFKQYLNKYQFNASLVLEDFLKDTLNILLTNLKYPKAIAILIRDENNLSKYLKLGITEANIELIPFNPLTLFVKIRGLISSINQIKKMIEEGHIEFDFYRYGLFNVLNAFTATDKSLFLTVKDADEDKVLYSLRIRNGQVVSVSTDLEKIIEVNTDDSIPKLIAQEPITHEDAVIFNNTADFYNQLLKLSMEEKPSETVIVKSTVEPKKVTETKVNPIRERKVYSFPYKGYTLYTQPYEGVRELDNALFAVAQIDDQILSSLRLLKIKGGDFKLLTSPLIKSYLAFQGFKEEYFLNLDGVKYFQTPYLGNRLESLIYLPEGILISGNLFGSYTSRELEFFDRVLLSHLRIYHYANISSNERLKKGLEILEPFKDKIAYIFPNYGYPIESSFIPTVWEVLNNLTIPEDFQTLYEGWKNLIHILPKEPKSFGEFVALLNKQNSVVLFNLVDEMEVLGVIPYEL
jgi:hypothetical protein